MHTVIISGGSGSRLWPISREANPKPFIMVDKHHSFLQKTFLRGTSLVGIESVTTITNQELFFRTEDEYSKLKHSVNLHYVLEPFGRNTAPAIAAAALEIQRLYGDEALILVLPADHLIDNQEEFSIAVSKAQNSASEGQIVTFGIKPTHPEVGFGYIEVDKVSTSEIIPVNAFVEKPDIDTAVRYLKDGRHFWNAGMFCFKADTILSEFEALAPEILSSVRNVIKKSKLSSTPENSVLRLSKDSFAEVPDESIDYALMEKSSRVSVIPCNLGWRDIGSWSAMSDLTLPDSSGNRILGSAETLGVSNCYINSPYRLTAAIGIEDIYIIDTPDALLISHKDKSQEVKKVVARLKERGDDLHQHHLTVHRPWGTYTVLEGGHRFKIKRIEVKPGASLSLQMHHHRSEHWIVVSGTAQVVNGDLDILLSINESTYIPAGNSHRLSNPGVIPLIMIEVQSGEYLEEDDIVRFEDTYGRC